MLLLLSSCCDFSLCYFLLDFIVCFTLFIFFFKQKTAYEMRISDWSSDVCSSDLETTFSQLWNKFIDRIFSRSWQGLWNSIKLKLLYYNLRHAGLDRKSVV